MKILSVIFVAAALVESTPLDSKRAENKVSFGSGGIKDGSPSVESTVDWREKGIVPPVWNQGQCGSNAIFSAVDCVEAQASLKSGKLVPLSMQNIIDCSGQQGCSGSLDQIGVYKFIKDQGGIDTKESYPYKNGTCEFSKGKIGALVTGYVELPSGSEEALQNAVESVGPVTVLVDASRMSFQMYTEGVYDDPECSSVTLDHGMLLVGFGELGGEKYWLLKNSWGSSWGEGGYIRMARGKGNRCGVATRASFPLVRLP